MANSKDVKKLVEELQKEIYSGFELLEEYKKNSEIFIKLMNDEIQETGLKFKNTDSLLFKKEKIDELKKVMQNHVNSPNESKKNFKPVELLIKIKQKIKNMIIYEKSFITFKRKKRSEKLAIYKRIVELQEALKNILPKEEYSKLLKSINEKKYKIGEKVYNFMHILGHLKAGKISNAVNEHNNINKYNELENFIKREKKMAEGTKEIIKNIKAAENKERKNSKKNNEKNKLYEKLSEIKQNILKIYEKNFKGVNIPKKIVDVIKILKQQQLLSKEEKEKIKILEKAFNNVLSKIQKMEKSS